MESTTTDLAVINLDEFSFDSEIVLEIFADHALETGVGKTSAL